MKRHGVDILTRYRHQTISPAVNQTPPVNQSADSAQQQVQGHAVQGRAVIKAQNSAMKERLLMHQRMHDLWQTSRVTFEEFLHYVIDRDARTRERHWDNYEEVAHPCAFHIS